MIRWKSLKNSGGGVQSHLNKGDLTTLRVTYLYMALEPAASVAKEHAEVFRYRLNHKRYYEE